MPMDSWESMKGEVCAICELPASHYWGGTPYCCQCHGGDMFSREETCEIHHLMDQGVSPSAPEFTELMEGFYAKNSN